MKIATALIVLSSLLGSFSAAAPLADDDYRRVLQKSPDYDNGERLFGTCSSCHGPEGVGRAESWVPRIGGERFAIVARQLVDYRHGLRWDERMQANSAEHRLADLQAVADVAAWVSRLDPPPPVRREEGQYVALGRQVYAAKCARCHGARGEGKTDAPRLAGQHYAYLVRQMHDTVEGRRPNMSVAHRRLIEPLDVREIEGVADAMVRQD
jgi:cytochrome c553